MIKRTRINSSDESEYDNLNKCGNTTIYLYGEIDNKIALDINIFLNQFNIGASPDKTIYVYINSQGGSLEAALSIISCLNLFKQAMTVNTVITGISYSAAAWIFLSGNKRSMSKFGSLMFHTPRFTIEEETLEQRESLTKFSKKQYDEILSNLLIDTKISLKEFKERSNNQDWFIMPNEAKRLGMTDEIL